MIELLKIKLLTFRAKRLYWRLDRLYGCFDCGNSLTEYMVPAAKQERKKLLAICRLLKRFQQRPKTTKSTGPR
jgi:uncharacterized CHY-type Zn-finger protein